MRPYWIYRLIARGSTHNVEYYKPTAPGTPWTATASVFGHLIHAEGPSFVACGAALEEVAAGTVFAMRHARLRLGGGR